MGGSFCNLEFRDDKEKNCVRTLNAPVDENERREKEVFFYSQ